MSKASKALAPHPRPIDVEKFMGKVNKLECAKGQSSGCWIWTGAKESYGYGIKRISGVKIKTHRLAYRIWHGPLDPNKEIAHDCGLGRRDNKLCVNPAHLKQVSHKENADGTVGMHGSVKISFAQVQEMKEKFFNGPYTFRDLEKEYGIGYTTVKRKLFS